MACGESAAASLVMGVVEQAMETIEMRQYKGMIPTHVAQSLLNNLELSLFEANLEVKDRPEIDPEEDHEIVAH